ncbi:unnamed protein product [Ectocarpus sp. 6 AP-2014]
MGDNVQRITGDAMPGLPRFNHDHHTRGTTLSANKFTERFFARPECGGAPDLAVA